MAVLLQMKYSRYPVRHYDVVKMGINQMFETLSFIAVYLRMDHTNLRKIILYIDFVRASNLIGLSLAILLSGIFGPCGACQSGNDRRVCRPDYRFTSHSCAISKEPLNSLKRLLQLSCMGIMVNFENVIFLFSFIIPLLCLSLHRSSFFQTTFV